MLQQLLPVIGTMLPPATWLALLKLLRRCRRRRRRISQTALRAKPAGSSRRNSRSPIPRVIEPDQGPAAADSR